jgi:hypothetical protein
MARLRRNFTSGVITDNPLTAGATSISSTNFANLPVVASPDIVAIVLDPLGNGGVPEVAYVTAHTAASPTVTVLRGQETAYGGSAGRQHVAGTSWIVSDTAVNGLDDTGWQTPTLLNSWVNYDAVNYPTAGYRRVGGVVYLKGIVKLGVVGTGTGAYIFTLAAGYRPAQFLQLVGFSNNGTTGVVSQIEIIGSDGGVRAGVGGNAWFSLDGISFRID